MRLPSPRPYGQRHPHTLNPTFPKPALFWAWVIHLESQWNHPWGNTSLEYPEAGAPRSTLVCDLLDRLTRYWCHD